MSWITSDYKRGVKRLWRALEINPESPSPRPHYINEVINRRDYLAREIDDNMEDGLVAMHVWELNTRTGDVLEYVEHMPRPRNLFRFFIEQAVVHPRMLGPEVMRRVGFAPPSTKEKFFRAENLIRKAIEKTKAEQARERDTWPEVTLAEVPPGRPGGVTVH